MDAGTTAVAGSQDKMIKLWDLGSEGLMHNCAPHNLHPPSLQVAVVSGDGRRHNRCDGFAGRDHQAVGFGQRACHLQLHCLRQGGASTGTRGKGAGRRCAALPGRAAERGPVVLPPRGEYLRQLTRPQTHIIICGEGYQGQARASWCCAALPGRAAERSAVLLSTRGWYL